MDVKCWNESQIEEFMIKESHKEISRRIKTLAKQMIIKAILIWNPNGMTYKLKKYWEISWLNLQMSKLLGFELLIW